MMSKQVPDQIITWDTDDKFLRHEKMIILRLLSSILAIVSSTIIGKEIVNKNKLD